MASIMYGKLLPDYGDLDNGSGDCPGYRLYILENDGGIALELMNANEESSTGKANSVFLNVSEAEELIEGIQEAINRAKSKNANHENRAKDC